MRATMSKGRESRDGGVAGRRGRGCGVSPGVSVAGTHRTGFTQTGTHVLALLAGAATASQPRWTRKRDFADAASQHFEAARRSAIFLRVWTIKVKLKNSEI